MHLRPTEPRYRIIRVLTLDRHWCFRAVVVQTGICRIFSQDRREVTSIYILAFQRFVNWGRHCTVDRGVINRYICRVDVFPDRGDVSNLLFQVLVERLSRCVPLDDLDHGSCLRPFPLLLKDWAIPVHLCVHVLHKLLAMLVTFIVESCRRVREPFGSRCHLRRTLASRDQAFLAETDG